MRTPEFVFTVLALIFIILLIGWTIGTAWEAFSQWLRGVNDTKRELDHYMQMDRWRRTRWGRTKIRPTKQLRRRLNA